MNSEQLTSLAGYATSCMLLQTPVEMLHEDGKKPAGFPLPIKKMQPGTDGRLRQEYRPIAVLDYINEVLTGEIAARAALDRAALKKESV